MARFDRVALLAICWFVVWTLVGAYIGRQIGLHGSGIVGGFFFALVTTFAWPWVLPNFIWEWMDE